MLWTRLVTNFKLFLIQLQFNSLFFCTFLFSRALSREKIFKLTKFVLWWLVSVALDAVESCLHQWMSRPWLNDYSNCMYFITNELSEPPSERCILMWIAYTCVRWRRRRWCMAMLCRRCFCCCFVVHSIYITQTFHFSVREYPTCSTVSGFTTSTALQMFQTSIRSASDFNALWLETRIEVPIHSLMLYNWWH